MQIRFFADTWNSVVNINGSSASRVASSDTATRPDALGARLRDTVACHSV